MDLNQMVCRRFVGGWSIDYQIELTLHWSSLCHSFYTYLRTFCAFGLALGPVLRV